MYSNGVTLNASSYSNLFTGSASGSLAVPVKPSAVLYSQFNYIHGISSGSGETGVPINKIRILNTLINQLVSMKKNDVAADDNMENLSDDQKDALIQQYQKQVQNTINQAQTTGYGLAGLQPEAGALFSISA